MILTSIKIPNRKQRCVASRHFPDICAGKWAGGCISPKRPTSGHLANSSCISLARVDFISTVLVDPIMEDDETIQKTNQNEVEDAKGDCG